MKRTDVDHICRNATFQGQSFHPRFVETHISWVLFTRDYAIKIKRPVKLPFLDFSTREKRLEYCRSELRLNRRLTNIYLGISSAQMMEDNWQFSQLLTMESGFEGGIHTDGEPVLVMARIDERMRMDHLAKTNELDHHQTRVLAKLVAKFHQACPIRKASHIPELWQNHWQEFFGLLKRMETRQFIEKARLPIIIEEDVNRVTEQLIPEIISRGRKGFVRDVHGDLHTANVFFTPQPVIFDCIEFNDQFRWMDQMDEVATLYADLIRLNRPHLASHFIKVYDQYNPGVLPNKDDKLFNYYCAYRLSIRSKVLIIKILNSKLSRESFQKHKIELNLFLCKISEFTEKVNRSG